MQTLQISAYEYNKQIPRNHRSDEKPIKVFLSRNVDFSLFDIAEITVCFSEMLFRKSSKEIGFFMGARN